MLIDFSKVVAFECLHDMSDPVRVLHTMHGLVNDQGAVIIMDEHTLDTFQPCSEAWEQIL